MSREAAPSVKPSPDEVIERLREAYPKTFTDPPTPLQIGILKQIRVAKPPVLEELANITINKAIRRWVRRDAYLSAICDRIPRVDLKGRPAGEISDEAVAEATRVLRLRKKRRRDYRRKQQQRAAKAAAAQAEPSSANAV